MCLRRDFFQGPIKFKAIYCWFWLGQTWLGCGGICKGIWEHPGINQGYFAPTYPQIRDIFTLQWKVEEVAADWGLNVKINEGNKVRFTFITGPPVSGKPTI